MNDKTKPGGSKVGFSSELGNNSFQDNNDDDGIRFRTRGGYPALTVRFLK
jgi:hypothetical protein